MKNKFSICSSLLTLALTILVSVSVQAQALNLMTLSGRVTAFSPADCAQAGSITIAGVTLPINQGVYLAFQEPNQSVQVIDGSLFLFSGRSSVSQVLNTNRTITVYLDASGRIATVPNLSGFSVQSAPNSANGINITGVVNAISPTSITINNVTFPLAAPLATPVADPTTVVRLTGSFNAAGQLGTLAVNPAFFTGGPTGSPYQTLKICGAPRIFTAESPITFNPSIIFNSAIGGFASGETACNLANGSLGLEVTNQGGSNAIVPGFRFPTTDISVNVDECLELNIDALGWITTGSKKVAGTGNSICGVVNSYAPAFSGPYPTNLNDNGQRGTLVISGSTFRIAPGHSITNAGVLTPGANVCITPAFDTAGNSAATLPGEQAFVRAFQLLNGTKACAGTTPCP